MPAKNIVEMKFKPALLHFKFNNFATLDSKPDHETFSEIQTDCNGHEWKMELWPGGHRDDDEPGWIGLDLHVENEDLLDVRCTFSVKDANGSTSVECGDDNEYFVWGYNKIMKRSVILDEKNRILQNGALCIDVGIQVKDDKDYLFQPKSDHSKNMLNLLRSGEDADTFFIVGGREVMIHKPIIKAHAPLLASHCGSSINAIKPEVFQLLLEHIYSGNKPTKEDVLEHGKGLIDAANKYELVGLKMFVENTLVSERVLTVENVAEYILFADAKCCPLLKEYAFAFFSVHSKQVLKLETSKCLKESGELLSEIILSMNPGNGEEDISTVNELRKELGKLGLDVDGSKDALVSRLQEAKVSFDEVSLASSG